MAKKNKIYRVPCTMTTYLHINVEAVDEDEAYDIAYNTDGGVFIEEDSWSDGWELNADCIEEITEEEAIKVSGKNSIVWKENK
tara:strand:- start:276 stop:524 length:249 start_codon:yes stop_codon:yes gene_type:complete